MYKSKSVIILLLLFLLGACATAIPVPQKTKFVTSLGGGFMIDRPTKSVCYAMSYELNKTFDSSIYAVIEFENPEGGKPFSATVEIPAKQKEIQVQSKKFKKISNNRNYLVILKLFYDSSFTKLITSHPQKIRFALDPSTVKSLGIELL